MYEGLESLSKEFFLTAGECDAEERMPLTRIAERIIEVATDHANALGIGYSTLIKYNIGWVLGRVSIQMDRYPGINETYTLTTWIESINRRFSERNFRITDAEGRVLGYARTVWSAIDFGNRNGADLGLLDLDGLPEPGLPCPIDKTPRIPALPADARSTDYTFRYCDLDFNRHVNTIRYLELLMDQWDLAHYDAMQPARLDLLFHHECRFGETIAVRVADMPGGTSDCELTREGVHVLGARFTWVRRPEGRGR